MSSEDAAEDQGHAEREIEEDQHHPADLGDRDGSGIGEAGAAPGGILPGCAQPLEHHGDAHDHIAEHHDRIVEVPAVLDRGEHARQADGQDQHTDHLHHGDEPENPVVGIIGRGEPGEIDPGPADGEACKAEADQRGGVVALRQRMGDLGGREAKANDERQVEQQLEWRCDAVSLVGITSAHAPGVMVERSGVGRRSGHGRSFIGDRSSSPTRECGSQKTRESNVQRL